jgi:hypothetical protein
MKTSELTGAALDWAVAKCEDVGFWDKPAKFADRYQRRYFCLFASKWEMGGPIIEREEISILHTTMRPSYKWEASQTPDEDLSVCEFGPTPLIAAMRCYVASELGDEIDVPEELTDENVRRSSCERQA